MDKYEKLKDVLAPMGRVVVAFSGGVDSALLAAAALDELGPDKVLALTGCSKTFPAREVEQARTFCSERGIRQILFETHELDNEQFRHNPKNRCYLCKHTLFETIAMLVSEDEFADGVIVEGSNTDDLGDYRPGRQALAELGIRSPMLEASLAKEDIRAISRKLGLPTWNKPSFACLASRFPYGDFITDRKLEMIDAAEQILIDRGFSTARVRVHGALARIEIAREDFERFIQKDNPDEVEHALRALGFNFIALDLAGYRSGSMNRTLGASDIS